MPNSLAYIHAAEIVPTELINILNGKYSAPLVDAQKFLEKILLYGLTAQQALQTVSHANFRTTYVKTLTQVLRIGTKSVQDWGQDMSYTQNAQNSRTHLGLCPGCNQKHTMLRKCCRAIAAKQSGVNYLNYTVL